MSTPLMLCTSIKATIALNARWVQPFNAQKYACRRFYSVIFAEETDEIGACELGFSVLVKAKIVRDRSVTKKMVPKICFICS